MTYNGFHGPQKYMYGALGQGLCGHYDWPKTSQGFVDAPFIVSGLQDSPFCGEIIGLTLDL